MTRVRLTIITKETVLIEFNGPILQFSIDNPAEKELIKSLGPDCLNKIFDKEEFKRRLLLNSKQELLISEALLNQKIIADIGININQKFYLFVELIHSSKYLNLT